MIKNDGNIVNDKLKDFRKIAQNIDKVYKIEGMRESVDDVANPYLPKQKFESKEPYISLAQHGEEWAEENVKKHGYKTTSRRQHETMNSVISRNSRSPTNYLNT